MKSPRSFSLWLRFVGSALLILAAYAPVLAADIRLYANGDQVADYDLRLSQVRSGDVVDLDGAKFTIVRFLGSGNTTKVFDIGSGQALRVPLARGLFNNAFDYRNFITSYMIGARLLKGYGVQAVQVDEAHSRAPDFLVVEKVQTQFSLKSYLRTRASMPAEEAQLIDARLKVFAESTAPLSAIGDFRTDQMHWTGTDWILTDFTAGTTTAVTVQAHTAFDSVSLDIPYALKQSLMNAVREKRRALGYEEGRARSSGMVSQCQRVLR